MDVSRVLHIGDNDNIYVVDHQSYYAEEMIDVTNRVFSPFNIHNAMENFFQMELGVSIDEMRELIQYIKVQRRPQDYI
jgi:hypothetical protein